MTTVYGPVIVLVAHERGDEPDDVIVGDGQPGKQDSCQVAVGLSVANERASLPVAWRLYLPRSWAEDAA